MQTKIQRPSSKLAVEEKDAVLAKTDKFKTGGTFFFTAGADTAQILPQSKIDNRITQMYQRRAWEERENGNQPLTAE